MLPRLALLFVLVLPLTAPLVAQGSDVEVTGEVATMFTRTRGASLGERCVHWLIPASALAIPVKSRNGASLFMYKGVGLVLDETSIAYAEIRRRGHKVSVRGKVIRVPPSRRSPDDPIWVLAVDSMAYKPK